MNVDNSATHKDARLGWFIVAISAVLGILFNYFLFGKIPGLAWPLYVVIVIAGLAVLSWSAKRPWSRASWCLAIGAIVFASGVALRASDVLTFLNIVLSLFLLFLLASEQTGLRFIAWPITEYAATVLRFPARFFHSWLIVMQRLVTKKEANASSAAWPIVRGVLLAIPLLIIFAVLFSSADLVFQKYAKDVLSLNISQETISRIFLVILVTIAFIGAYSYSLFQRYANPARTNSAPQHHRGTTEVAVMLGLINALFLTFIILQLAYLFGGQETIVKQGFTYADYARRGFFELIAVALISLLLIWAIGQLMRNSAGHHPRSYKFLSTVLIVQVFIIMASAFKRLWLYEQAYGFTTQRTYSHAFLIWLGIVFLLVVYHMYIDRRDDRFAMMVFGSGLLAVLILNIWNPDAFIAKRNIELSDRTGKIDAFYLSSLSNDAVAETITALNSNHAEVKSAVGRILYQRWDALQHDQMAQGWQSLNYTRQQAKRLLNDKIGELRQYKDATIGQSQQSQ